MGEPTDTAAVTAPPDPDAPALVRDPSAPSHEPLAEPDAHVPYTLRVAAGYGWRIVALAAALWVVGQLVGALTFVLVAAFVGAVITALVLPAVDLFARVMPRGLAVALSLLLAALLVLAIFSFIIVAFINQAPELANQFASGVASLQEWLQNSPLHVDSVQIDEWLQTAQTWLQQNAPNLVNGFLGGLGTVGQVLTGFVLSMFVAIFFLYDGKGIWGWIVSLTPGRSHTGLRTSGDLAWGTFSAYARGTVFIALTNAILVGIGLFILRVPLPIPLALLVFFGTFIPYIGAPVAMLAAAVVGLAANGPWTFLAVIVMITIIGQIEGNVLQPVIMSKQVALHPLAVILSVTIGGVTAGIIGAVVAVPIASVVWVVLRYLLGRDPEHPRAPVLTANPSTRVAGDEW